MSGPTDDDDLVEGLIDAAREALAAPHRQPDFSRPDGGALSPDLAGWMRGWLGIEPDPQPDLVVGGESCSER